MALAAAGAAPSARLNLSFTCFALGLAALLLNAIFTMAQTGLSAIGPFAVEQLKEDQTFASKYLDHRLGDLAMLEHRFGTAALLMLLLFCFLFTKGALLIYPEFAPPAAGIGIVLALVLHVLLVEVISRSAALSDPLKTLKFVGPLAEILALPLMPLLAPVALIMPRRPRGNHPTAASDMHLRLLPSLGGVERVVDDDIYEWIDSARDFKDLTAEDIMTPRTEVEGLSRSLPASEMYDRLRKTEFSRLVVYEETLDQVVGVVLAKAVLLERPEDPLSLMRAPVEVAESTHLPALLALIRQHKTHLLVVRDEFGGMAGIVTLHDLFESILGHIEDVEDEQEHEAWIDEDPEQEGRWLINGRVELWEVNEELHLDLDEEVARTIGGYVFNNLGRVAKAGDEVPFDGGTLRVEEMQDKRIHLLSLVLEDPQARTQGSRETPAPPQQEEAG